MELDVISGDTMRQLQRGNTDDRFTGAAMIAAALLAVFAMGLHPRGADGGLPQLVHGALMVFALTMLAGFARYAQRLGLAGFPVMAGLVAYAVGTIANLLAATINGFVTPALTAGHVSREILRLCWELNQAFAHGAVYAVSAAFALWGVEILLRGRGRARLFGLAGLAAGAAPAAILALDVIGMGDVAGAFAVYAAQLSFTVLVGACLIRHANTA